MHIALIYLIVINIVATIFFCIDKFLATKKRNRVPELILHLLELAGGIFLIIPLMFIIRHKNKKLSYKLVSFIILALWIFFIAVSIFSLN